MKMFFNKVKATYDKGFKSPEGVVYTRIHISFVMETKMNIGSGSLFESHMAWQ